MMVVDIPGDGPALYWGFVLMFVAVEGTLLFQAGRRAAEARRGRVDMAYARAAGNLLAAVGFGLACVSVARGEPPRSAAFGPDAVELRYRWRTDRIRYADVRDVRREPRRGRDELHLRVVTADRDHAFAIVPGHHPGAREAVERFAGELRGRVGLVTR